MKFVFLILTIVLAVSLSWSLGIVVGVATNVVLFFVSLFLHFGLHIRSTKIAWIRELSWGLVYGSIVALIGTLAILTWFIFNFDR